MDGRRHCSLQLLIGSFYLDGGILILSRRGLRNMAQYVEVEQAVEMSGLRVVLSPGVPGPWSEAAKGILFVKKIPYIKVRQELGGENLPLLRWSSQTTAPVFVYENERP